MNSMADTCSERPLLLPRGVVHPSSTVLTMPLEKPWALPPFALLGNPQGCCNTRLSARAMPFVGAFPTALTMGETCPIHTCHLNLLCSYRPQRTNYPKELITCKGNWHTSKGLFCLCKLPLHRVQVCSGIKISMSDPRVALAIPLCLFADVSGYFILAWAYSASFHGHGCCYLKPCLSLFSSSSADPKPDSLTSFKQVPVLLLLKSCRKV